MHAGMTQAYEAKCAYLVTTSSYSSVLSSVLTRRRFPRPMLARPRASRCGLWAGLSEMPRVCSLLPQSSLLPQPKATCPKSATVCSL